MWDFDIGRTFGILVRTWPFVALRLVVYFTIALVYIMATGGGAAVGYGIGAANPDPDAAASFAFWGGLAGFGLVAVILYWIREYVLYVVKAGHIAVMVHLIDGREIPQGQSQFDYASVVVRARFAEASILFAVDQLVKGGIRAVTGLIGGVSALLPIPGLQALARFGNAVIRLSLTYVDEIVLGYNIRTGSASPFVSARRGVVLYAQNGRAMVRNAAWLALVMWALTLLVFLVMTAPAAAVLYLLPEPIPGLSLLLAVVFAWAIKAALLEPFAIAALMQAYFRKIEGQLPNPEWDRRLAEGSSHFRELREKASGPLQPRHTGTAALRG